MQAYKLLLIVTALTAVSKAQITPGVFFSNLGGAGSYPQVVYQPNGTGAACDITNTCQKQPLNIPAHNLAPFDQEISLHFRGPLDLVRIAVYQPVQGHFQLVSNWQPGVPSSNMSFLMNCENEYDVCQGPSLGYSNAQGSACSAAPEDLSGFLGAGLELTVMSGAECNGDCGWYRGQGYHAWSGDKIFVVETSMPFSGVESDIPAVWSLNAEIPRTGQYVCNCWPDCGEFDIAEVVQNGATEAYQTLYSYNGDLSSQGHFPRPVNGPSTYVVHYSITDNRIYAINVPGGCFQYSQVLSSAYINALHTLTVDVNLIATAPNSQLVGTCPSVPPGAPLVPATSVPTDAPTIAATAAPTVAPTDAPTNAPTKLATTSAPTKAVTNAPTTRAPTNAATKAPTIKGATTHAPTTKAATTHAPTTKAATKTKTTQAPATLSPTVSKVTTAAPMNLCGSTCSCCNDVVIGPVCYDPTSYNCESGRLCPKGTGVCGNACFDLSMYTCANEALQPVL